MDHNWIIMGVILYIIIDTWIFLDDIHIISTITIIYHYITLNHHFVTQLVVKACQPHLQLEVSSHGGTPKSI